MRLPCLALWAWRMQFMLRPDCPGRVLCARCGLTATPAIALERRLCEPLGLLPRGVRSARPSGAYVAAVAAGQG